MKAETYILIFLIIIAHFIGSYITIIIHSKQGMYKWASKNGDGIRYSTPSDILFEDIWLWEINLILFFIFKITDLINKYFYKKYK